MERKRQFMWYKYYCGKSIIHLV